MNTAVTARKRNPNPNPGKDTPALLNVFDVQLDPGEPHQLSSRA
jgi:hypothetical protein